MTLRTGYLQKLINIFKIFSIKRLFLYIFVVIFFYLNPSNSENNWITKKQNEWITKKQNEWITKKQNEWITKKNKKNDLVFITLLPLGILIIYLKRITSK